MIRSMTGFGRSQDILDGMGISVEIKSVNHRYFECSVRTPRSYSYLEEKLKSYVQSRVSRGKIDVGVTIQNGEIASCTQKDGKLIFEGKKSGSTTATLTAQGISHSFTITVRKSANGNGWL